MEKNEKEKNFLYEWGRENGKQYCFSIIENEKESYFMKREEKKDIKPYIREYGFDTLPQLTKELEMQWEHDEVLRKIIKIIGIAAIKNRPSETVKEKVQIEDKKEMENKLPVFIYNF